MKFIELGHGKKAIVDEEDFERVKQFSWHVHPGGYAYGWIGNSKVLMHRFVMKSRKGLDTDHIDGNGLNNRRENLRQCTRSQNLQNKHRVIAKSGFKGVFKSSNRGKWMAAIVHKGRMINLGHFTEKRHAAMAYDIWAIELFGEYAHTNFPAVNLST